MTASQPGPPPPRTLKPGLAVMLVLVLSIAILPLGLISVYQTDKVLEERQSLSETALLERTQTAASQSREVIRSAISSAETLAVLIPSVLSMGLTCDAIMENVVQQADHFSFAGYIDGEGGDSCTSLADDAAVNGPFAELGPSESRRQNIVVQPLEFLGGVASVSVSVPVFDGGRWQGVVWIAVPTSVLSAALSQAAQDVDLVLLQHGGEIIATEDYTDNRRSVLPKGQTLQDLAPLKRTTFRGENRDGQTRDFAILPIAEGRVFVLGSWEPRSRGGIKLPIYEQAMALYFPLVMWVIAIGVAYVGVHRLVIRHIRRLRSWMRLYSSGNGNLGDARLDHAPEELEVVAEAFRAMTRRLSEQDRAREEDLREKTVLLREVHHRVKNNLQLISSMMNMQIRATDSDEAMRLLRHVQDRVMALSAIHRYLYMARKLSSLRADQLLAEIIQQLVIVGTVDDAGHRIRVATELDPVEVNPDQSVPLSLLATEAAMNAVKYCGAADTGEAWINIALKLVDDETLCLSVVNSLAPDAPPADDTSGLGSQLIKSFAAQLGGTLEIEALPERHELHVVFPLVWQDGEDDDGPDDIPGAPGGT